MKKYTPVSTPPKITKADVPCYQCICVAACKGKEFQRMLLHCEPARMFYIGNDQALHSYHRYLAIIAIFDDIDIDRYPEGI